MRAFALPLLLAAALTACSRGSEGAVEVAVIGTTPELFATGDRLAAPGELARSATAQGLVRLDEAGQVVPGLAERWIVTDDGASYIFRIREMDLRGGQAITARTVQQALMQSIRHFLGTSLGLDLAQVRDIRAMTGRVIEVRLKSPMPGFLQLLAQPELGVVVAGQPAGPMTLTRQGNTAHLAAMPPEARGLPAQPRWAEDVRPVHLTALDAAAAVNQFSEGRSALVLGGTVANLPLATLGPLSRGTVRIGATFGLLGLDVVRADGFLRDATNREALALALDRPALIKPFNIAGWVPTTRIVAPGLPDDPGLVGERWEGIAMAERRAAAAQRVARWKGTHGARLSLSVSLPPGPGSDLLFAGLREQFGAIGITLARASKGQRGDLALRDRAARYAGARWFLNQFNCSLGGAVCSAEADARVALALEAPNTAQQNGHLAEAERVMAQSNGYIPIGAPIRWALVRSGVVGYADSPWALHPLFPLSRAPI